MDPMGILNIIKSSTRLSWKKRSSWWCALAPAWKRIQPHGWRKWYLEHVPTDELSTSVVTVCFLSVYYVWITYDYCKIKKHSLLNLDQFTVYNHETAYPNVKKNTSNDVSCLHIPPFSAENTHPKWITTTVDPIKLVLTKPTKPSVYPNETENDSIPIYKFNILTYFN